MGRIRITAAPALLALLAAAGCGTQSAGPFASAATTAGATSGSNAAAPPASGTTAAAATAPAPAPAPAPAGPTYVVSGWEPYWARSAGDAAIDANTGQGLDEVEPFGIGLKADGTLSKRSGAEDPARTARIRSHGGEVIPTVYDVDDSHALGAVLASASATATAIQSIVDLLDQGGYDGVDIDFEHATSGNRAAFSRFVTDLGREVRARGKVFSVTLPGKRSDLPSWAGYDYAALGAAADRVKLMTYGYSGPWSAAGPIAPTTWITRVLDYAVTVIPAGKLQVGIPFYGYDWPANGGTVHSVTFPRAQTLLALSAGGLQDHAARGEAWFTYRDTGGVDHGVVLGRALGGRQERPGRPLPPARALGVGPGLRYPAPWDAIRGQAQGRPVARVPQAGRAVARAASIRASRSPSRKGLARNTAPRSTRGARAPS